MTNTEQTDFHVEDLDEDLRQLLEDPYEGTEDSDVEEDYSEVNED